MRLELELDLGVNLVNEHEYGQPTPENWAIMHAATANESIKVAT